MTDHDDLSAFRKFIEEMLDLSALSEHSELSESSHSHHNRQPSSASAISPFQKTKIHNYLESVFRSLISAKFVRGYWEGRLSPLERETRIKLRDLILRSLRPAIRERLDDEQLQQLIIYIISVSWVARDQLKVKYNWDGTDSNSRELPL